MVGHVLADPGSTLVDLPAIIEPGSAGQVEDGGLKIEDRTGITSQSSILNLRSSLDLCAFVVSDFSDAVFYTTKLEFARSSGGNPAPSVSFRWQQSPGGLFAGVFC